MKRKTKLKSFLFLGVGAIAAASISSAVMITNENNSSQNLIQTNGKTLSKSHIIGNVLLSKSTNPDSSGTDILNNITLPSNLFSQQNIDSLNNQTSNNEGSYNFVPSSSSLSNKYNSYVQNSEKKVLNYIQKNGLKKGGFNTVLENQLGVSSSYVNDVVDNANTLKLAWDNTLFSWTRWNLNYWLNDHSLASTIQGFNQIATENGWWFFPLFQNNKQIPGSQYKKFIKAVTLLNVSNHTYYVEIVPQSGVNIDLTQNNIWVYNYKINVTISNGNVSTINASNLQTDSSLMNIYQATQDVANARVKAGFSNYTSPNFTGNYSVMTEQRLLAWDETQYINAHGYSADYNNAISDWYKMNYAYDIIPTLNKSWVSYYKYQLYVYSFYINRVNQIYQSVLNQVSSQIESLPTQISNLQSEINNIKPSNNTIDQLLNLQLQLTHDEAQYMQDAGYTVSSEILSQWNTANSNYNWLIDNESQNLNVIENSVPYLSFSSFVNQTNKLYQAVTNDVTKNSSTLQKSYLSTLISTLNVTVQFGLSKTDNGQAIWDNLNWMLNVFDKTYLQMINDEYEYVKLSTTNTKVLSEMNSAYTYVNSFYSQLLNWLEKNSNYNSNKMPHSFYTLQLNFQNYAKEANSIYQSVANYYQNGLKILQNDEAAAQRFATAEMGEAIAASVATGISIALAAGYWAASWFFGITVPEAIAASISAAATAAAMGFMWASYASTNQSIKKIEQGISDWMYYSTELGYGISMLNYAWDDVKIVMSTEIFGQIRGITAAVAAEETVIEGTIWADPATGFIWGVNLTLYGAIIITSIAINAMNKSPLNLVI